MRRRPCQAACGSEKTTGLLEVGIHECRGTWHDGTWNDCWNTPDRQSSSSSSIPRAGWTWYDWRRHPPWSNQGWLQSNSPVETTINDPRQCGGERDEVIPSLVVVVAWLEAGLLDAREGETEEPFHVGRCSRRDQMSVRQQLRRRKSLSTSHREMRAAISST